MKSYIALLVILVCASTVEARRRAQANVHSKTTHMAASSINSNGTRTVSATKTTETTVTHDGLAEVNAERAKRGLRPYVRDDRLTQGACAAALHRAARLIHGHTANDFQFLVGGHRQGDVAGCGALTPWWGFGACAMYGNYTYAGAASVRGRDGLMYHHLFVR